MTNYDLLRQKANDLIVSAREALDKELTRPERTRRERDNLNIVFKWDSEGLTGHLEHLQRMSYPLDDNFNVGPEMLGRFEISEGYQQVVQAIKRHIQKLTRYREGRFPVV